MNVTHIKNYDAINELPSDENPVSENEMKIVNMLFKEKEKPRVTGMQNQSCGKCMCIIRGLRLTLVIGL
jgi:hypothetical protein